ncbi:MAG: secretory lipase [Solirubrobacterales bacterium]|nr:secretory lipase [Solirubrobacterales bacterium]
MTLAAVLLAGAVAAGAVLNGPPPASFYAHAHVKPADAGTIFRQARLRGPSGFTVKVVLYHSRTATGRDVIDSGVVAMPAGRPPKGGFPVLAFAHGTTGFSDATAPSRTGDTGTAYSIADLIARFIPRGWVLALPDYEGLGTAGPLPYADGASAAHSVLDMVRAARRLAPGRLASRYAIVGHSEGGHAALWAGQLAHAYAPELRLRAVVASAPGADLAAIARERTRGPGTTIAVLGLMADWHVVYGAPLERMLTPAGQRAAAAIYADHQDSADLSQPVFTPEFSVNASPWGALVRRNTPGARPITAPTLILVSKGDEQVPADTNIALATRLRKRGDNVKLTVLDSADHAHTLTDTERQWLTFVSTRLRR